MKLFLLLVLAFFDFKFAQSKSYENFKVYSVYCESRNDVESLKFWELNPMIDFWTSLGANKTTSILVDPSLEGEFEEFLSYENFNYEILIENVGE
jgi:Carboxypeptidase activation peptide